MSRRFARAARQFAPRQGFALVIALLAIVLIGALVTGAMFATTEETKVGTSGAAREIALMSAESAIASLVSSATLDLPTTIGVRGTLSQRSEISAHPVTTYVTRLDSTIYWVVAQAVADPVHSGAQRRVGVLVTTHRRPDGSIAISPISERSWSELF